MKDISEKEEKRNRPRVKTRFKIGLPKNNFGESVDISEGGLSFDSIETISSPTLNLQINFPGRKHTIAVNAKLIWERDLEDGRSLYGVEFVDLDENQRSELRKELIEAQISGLLNDIEDREIKKQVSDFFLTDLLRYTDEIATIISMLPKDGKPSVELEEKLTKLSNLIILRGHSLEDILSNKRIMQKIRDNFRHLLGVWAYKSPIMKRAFEKPRGYPGDYLMLEIVYDNRPTASGIGYYFDKYFLSNPYAVAVRYRKDKLREILKAEIQRCKLKTMKIFDIACGSCREIKELPREIFQDKKVIFTCLDWDEEALEFSKEAVKILPKNAEFKFVKEDIMNIIKDSKFFDAYGRQDLVYSIGLIDYIPDRILKTFIKFFYGLLREKGKLILTHKNKEKTFSPLPPAWFCDWKFVPRTKNEAIDLFYNCGIQASNLETEVDEFNDIFYFTITKK